MWLDILVYVAVIGAIALAIYSVYKRIKNTDANTAGYVFNGKNWVAWLLLLCIISALFIGFIMPLFAGGEGYHPEWGTLGIMFWAVILYICYAIIAFVPATAEEVEANKAAGNTVLGSVGATTASMFKTIFAAIGAILVALPGMIGSALNPVLAVKTIGSTVYKVIGTGFSHVIGGILALVLIAVLVFAIIYIASLVLAILGTFVIGIIAIIKFVKNNFKK